MEPIGFAILIETLLTFCLFVFLFAKLEKNENDEKIENAIETKILKDSEFHLKKMKKKFQHEKIFEDPDSFFSRIFFVFRLAKIRFVKFTKIQRANFLFFCFLLFFSLILSIFLFIFFFSEIRGNSGKKSENFYEIFLIVRIILYGILTICGIFCILKQKKSEKSLKRLKVRGHVKLDLNLLLISLISVLIFNEFLMQAAASPPKNLNLETKLKILHFLDSIFCVFQAISQVFFVARSLTYKTHLGSSGNSPEFFCLFALLILNFVLWITELFERKYSNIFNQVAREYYNESLWVMVTEITYPLMIFYHFHSVFLIFALLAKHFKHKKSRWWISKQKIRPVPNQIQIVELNEIENGAGNGTQNMAGNSSGNGVQNGIDPIQHEIDYCDNAVTIKFE